MSPIVLTPAFTEGRRHLADAYEAVREQVRGLGTRARETLDRVGDAAERYASVKIERRVKPPVLAALILGGAALTVALVAALRK